MGHTGLAFTIVYASFDPEIRSVIRKRKFTKPYRSIRIRLSEILSSAGTQSRTSIERRTGNDIGSSKGLSARCFFFDR